MKTTGMSLVAVLALCLVGRPANGGPAQAIGPRISVNVDDQVATNQNQDQSQSASASGGDSQSDSASNSTANVSLSTNSQSNYETRTPPLTMFPPYLPYWTHGGWGTVKAYFPNGPTANDQIYETTFDPQNPSDMRELRSVLHALPHAGVLEAVGGVLNGVAVALFGAPDTYFHGRGLEIANSIVRDRRPEGKALLVFIDSNVDMCLLAEEGYAYMGKVSVEGDPDRNWDQAYKAAVSEALLWDVDILLISGGMKGVTTGTNITFPSAAAGYSQVNYSLSLLGGKATGITEGKGKAILSGEAFRYCPQRVERRRIPAEIYDRIRARPLPAASAAPAPGMPARQEIPLPAYEDVPETIVDWSSASATAVMPIGTPAGTTVPTPTTAPVPATGAAVAPAAESGPACGVTCAAVGTAVTAAGDGSRITTAAPAAPAAAEMGSASNPAKPVASAAAPARRSSSKRSSYNGPGITISQELFDLAGFPDDQEVAYLNLR